MNKCSTVLMKFLRRIVNKIQGWYRYTSFVDGLSQYGENIEVKGKVNLWNDYTSIKDWVNIYPGVTLWGPGEIKIGSHVEVGINTTIYASKSVIIKDNVSIAAGCYIIDSNHGIKKGKLIREQVSICKGPVIIEEDVWIGAGAKVLSGVHIGRGAVVGAQSVVNEDIPEYAIAVGVPAKIVGYRTEG